MPQRLLFRPDFQVSQAAFAVGQRPPQQLQHLLLPQRLQLKNLRARHQRRVDKEKWVVRRRPDQPHHPAFHVRQQHILLRLVEAVDFVNEKNGGLTCVFQAVGRPAQHPPHVRHVGLHPAQPLKLAPCLPRDDLRQRRFPRPRRPVKNKRLNPIRLDGPPQQHPRRENVTLSRELVQIARPHPRRQRLALRRLRAWPLGRGNFRLRRVRE